MSELNSRARDLIASVAEGDGPTPDEKARLRAAVLARVGATAAVGSTLALVASKGGTLAGSLGDAGPGGAAATTSTTSTTSLAFGIAAKALAVAAVVAVGSAAYLSVSTPSRHVAPGREAPPVSAPLPLRTVEPGPAREPVATATRAEPSAITSTPSSAPASPPVPAIAVHGGAVPDRARGQASERAGGLDEETSALAQALAALRDADPGRAMRLLDEQDARYALGLLGEERAATRIDALCAVGRLGEARAAVAVFLREHPRSLLAARVGASCGAAPPR